MHSISLIITACFYLTIYFLHVGLLFILFLFLLCIVSLFLFTTNLIFEI